MAGKTEEATSCSSMKIPLYRALLSMVLAVGTGGWVNAQVPAQRSMPVLRPNEVIQANPNQPNRLDSSDIKAPSSTGQATLRTYNVPSRLIGTVGAHLQLQYHGQSEVTITTDPNTQQLMVMAPADVQQQIAIAIERLLKDSSGTGSDQGMAHASHQESIYSMRNLTWRELEDALKRLGGDKMTITTERNGELAQLKLQNHYGMNDIFRVDRRSNQVTLVGTRPTVSAWLQVIHSLDSGQANTHDSTHVVPLSPAQPRSIRRMIQLVKATVQQEDEYAGELDDPIRMEQPLGGDEAVTALGTMDTLSSASGLLGDVQIEIIDDIGLIIVKGSKRDVQRTLQVIDQIKEQAKMTEPVIEVLRLTHANAEAVATEVTRLYESVYQQRQGTVSITPLVQPNALLIIGRQEIVDSVKTLVAKLDQPLDPQDQLMVIRLKHASAVDLETRVRDFFVQRPGSDQENRAALGTRVRVVSDFRTNSLIIQAAPRELVEVEKLIKELDVEGSDTENRVQVFRLKHALAEDLQRVIQEIVTGQTTTPAGAGQSQASIPSSRLTFVTVDGGKVDSGVLAGVVVTADPSVNALVVKAPSANIPLLAKLIQELDSLPSAEAQVKIFQLRNSDATTVALTLQNLYGLAPTAGQGPQFSLQNNFVSNLSATGLTAGGESSLVQLRITPEARTNSVIVSGGETDLRVLEAMILRLDEDVADSRRFEVIWLRNATSENVSNALATYFQNYLLTQNQLVTTGVISPQELVNRQVFVVPEPATNSILLSASRELFDVAIRLIERMDRRPPMVAIQVMIAEVALDDRFELGAEWGLQDSLLFRRGSVTGGTLGSPIFGTGPALNTPNTGANLAGQALSNFGVGRSNADGVGGLVLSASSETVGVLVRALQTAGRIQVLNRPQLTTLDSQPATATVGGLVPRVVGISQAGLGVPQQIQTQDVPVGLILSVLPRVSPDGLILLQVGVENSKVGDPNAGIPIGFGPTGEVIRSPIIDQIRSETVVSAYSGQTVVFSGLISKTRTSVRRQIPVLGSIPWIGAAFRFDSETEERKELLVVLTPRIIQSDEDYEILKNVESSRMSWCLADVLNIHGDVGLSGGNGLWGPARGQMLYPDVNPEPLPDRSIINPNGYYPMLRQSEPEYYPGPNSIIEAVPMSQLDLQPGVVTGASFPSESYNLNSALPTQSGLYQPPNR
jgi:general secretion pathway protein D